MLPLSPLLSLNSTAPLSDSLWLGVSERTRIQREERVEARAVAGVV